MRRVREEKRAVLDPLFLLHLRILNAFHRYNPSMPAPATTPSNAMPTTNSPFHVMTKPIGPICNLDCKYCFYLEKEKLCPDKSNWRNPGNVLERYIQQYIPSQDIPELAVAWQGGEPTLLGLE